MNSKNQKGQMQQQQQYSSEDQEKNFERQAWLAQQQRAWQLQDRQFKQQAVAGFQNYWNTGGDVKAPTQSTANLMNFDPNKLGSLPINGGAQPAPTGPLGQLTQPGAKLPVNIQ